jgi:hypothetical protein
MPALAVFVAITDAAVKSFSLATLVPAAALPPEGSLEPHAYITGLI